MAYFNWGEQVANSFVTMMANNQQKRLEQQRLGMEQQRLQDTMQTNALQRSAYEQEMKQREYEMKKAKDEDSFWAGLGNTNVAIRDRNNDGTINASDYEAMPFQRAMQVDPMTYNQYQYNQWDSKANTFVPTQGWFRRNGADTALNLVAATANQGKSLYDTNTQADLERQRNSIAASGVSVERERLALARKEFDEEQKTRLRGNLTTVQGEIDKVFSKVPREDMYVDPGTWQIMGSNQQKWAGLYRQTLRDLVEEGYTESEATGIIKNALYNRIYGSTSDYKVKGT